MQGSDEVSKDRFTCPCWPFWLPNLSAKSKYKETSDAGLTTNIPINLPEC